VSFLQNESVGIATLVVLHSLMYTSLLEVEWDYLRDTIRDYVINKFPHCGKEKELVYGASGYL
jgi:hypothetical protein